MNNGFTWLSWKSFHSFSQKLGDKWSWILLKVNYINTSSFTVSRNSVMLMELCRVLVNMTWLSKKNHTREISDELKGDFTEQVEDALSVLVAFELQPVVSLIGIGQLVQNDMRLWFLTEVAQELVVHDGLTELRQLLTEVLEGGNNIKTWKSCLEIIYEIDGDVCGGCFKSSSPFSAWKLLNCSAGLLLFRWHREICPQRFYPPYMPHGK